MSKERFLSQQDIEEAAVRLAARVHHTPVFTSRLLNELCGAAIFFKCENFQKTGSFKARGAINSVLKLNDEEAAKGVATHSSGNHGQALAWAARQRGIRAFMVMPENAPGVKVEAVKNYGGEVIFCKPNLEAREKGLREVIAEHGAIFIPPYNFENTIEGQATAAREVFEELEEIDFLLAPVGGGGLLSGSALSGKYFSPGTKIIGCEPKAADDAFRSFKAGKLIPQENPQTLADGLRTSLGEITFRYILELADDILTCSEEGIVKAMRLIRERMKIVVEASSAVPLACIMENPGRFKGKRVAVILSGGNVQEL